MNDLQNGFEVLAAMLGVDTSVLRAISVPWASDANESSITLAEFALRLDDAQRLAGQLNNTNAWEQAITGALPPDEIRRTLPTAGVPHPASHDDTEGKQ